MNEPGCGHFYLRVNGLLVGCDPHILREAVSGAAGDPEALGMFLIYSPPTRLDEVAYGVQHYFFIDYRWWRQKL